MKLLLLSVLALIAACGGSGFKGVYTSEDGKDSFDFKGGEIVRSLNGEQFGNKMNYEFVGGKVWVWGPSEPKHEVAIDGVRRQSLPDHLGS
jgi:hypothetical protein